MPSTTEPNSLWPRVQLVFVEAVSSLWTVLHGENLMRTLGGRSEL